VFLVRVAERVCQEQAQGDMLGTGRVGFQQIDDLGGKPQLRDRERAELNLEADDPRESRADRRGGGALSLIVLDSLGNGLKDAKQKRPGAHRRVGEGDVRRRQSIGNAETAVIAQRLINEPHHRGDDLGRRVIRASPFPKRIVVNAQEEFVEIKPRLGVALADRRPMHNVEHARQGFERGFQGGLVIDIVGQDSKRGSDKEICLPQQHCDAVETVRKDDPLGACHQEAKRDGLSITVGECLVRSVGE
jgi:hypothetical protein